MNWNQTTHMTNYSDRDWIGIRSFELAGNAGWDAAYLNMGNSGAIDAGGENNGFRSSLFQADRDADLSRYI